MLNIFKIFKQNKSNSNNQEDIQCSISDMKDELPLVNKELLSETKEMVVVYVQGTNEIEIGDIMNINFSSGEGELGYIIENINEKKGIVKLKKGGSIIKVK